MTGICHHVLVVARMIAEVKYVKYPTQQSKVNLIKENFWTPHLSGRGELIFFNERSKIYSYWCSTCQISATTNIVLFYLLIKEKQIYKVHLRPGYWPSHSSHISRLRTAVLKFYNLQNFILNISTP